MSLRGVRLKSPEVLASERAAVESVLGDGLFYGELLPTYDLDEFSARASFYVGALRHARAPEEDTEQQVEEMRQWLDAMNSLQAYVLEAEEDPDSSMLRPGQVPFMRELSDFFEEDAAKRRGGLVVGPTGVGKMVMITEMVHATGLPTALVVPTKELLHHARDTVRLHAQGRHLDLGFVCGEEKTIGKDLTVITYASLLVQLRLGSKAIFRPQDFKVVAYDEVHELLGQKRRTAVTAFPHALQIGFTATDKYSDKKKASDLLPINISDMDIIEGQNRLLVAPHHNIIVRTNTDMRTVYVASTGDYAQDVMYKTINTDERNKLVVDTYLEVFPDKKAIFFCAGIKHAEHLAAMFNKAGVRAGYIHGDMSKEERKDVLKKYRTGEIMVLTNDRVCGAGVDIDTVELVGMVAPTLSPLKLKQNCGRATRLLEKMPDKVAYLLQFIDNNYTSPPVIFAEQVASGYAQHGWEGFVFPDLDVSRFNQDAEILVDPLDVQQLAEEFSEARKVKPRDPPENWMHVDEVAEQWGCTRERVYNTLQRCQKAHDTKRRKLEDAGEPTDDLFEPKAHKGNYQLSGVDAQLRTYLSPELRSTLQEYRREWKPPPSRMYRTRDELALLYGYSTGWVQNVLTTKDNRARFAKYWDKYTPTPNSMSEKAMFSPEFIRLAAESDKRPDYSQMPPVGWLPEPEVAFQIGVDIYEEGVQQLASYGASYLTRQGGRLWFGDDETGQYFCSPNYNGILRYILKPHPSYTRISDIYRHVSQFDVSLETLQDEARLFGEKDPGSYGTGWCLKLNPLGKLEMYCNERVTAHLKERAYRAEKSATASEEAIQKALERLHQLTEEYAARVQDIKAKPQQAQELVENEVVEIRHAGASELSEDNTSVEVEVNPTQPPKSPPPISPSPSPSTTDDTLARARHALIRSRRLREQVQARLPR